MAKYLAGFDDPSGAKKIILAGGSPMVGIMFEPLWKDGMTLRIESGQEIYEFKRKNP